MVHWLIEAQTQGEGSKGRRKVVDRLIEIIAQIKTREGRGEKVN